MMGWFFVEWSVWGSLAGDISGIVRKVGCGVSKKQTVTICNGFFLEYGRTNERSGREEKGGGERLMSKRGVLKRFNEGKGISEG